MTRGRTKLLVSFEVPDDFTPQDSGPNRIPPGCPVEVRLPCSPSVGDFVFGLRVDRVAWTDMLGGDPMVIVTLARWNLPERQTP
jgi:hypothetical protein